MVSSHNGLLYEAGSSRHRAVTVNWLDDLLAVYADDELIDAYSQGTLKTVAKVGSLPREIVLPNSDLLSIDGDVTLDEWLDNNADKFSLSRMEREPSWVIFSVLCTPILLFALIKYVVPALAVSFAAYVPYSVKQVASEHTLTVLDKTVLNNSQLSDEKQQVLQAAFAPILTQLTHPPIHYRVLFRESKAMGANAFALPDGTVVFTDGIVDLTDAEPRLLKAILLHEIGHVEHNHSMRLVAESLATSLMATYFLADASGIVDLFLGVSSTVVQNQYSQKLEWEADTFALENGAKVGLVPGDFADAMQTLADSVPADSQTDRLLSSHPLLIERIERARQLSDSHQ